MLIALTGGIGSGKSTVADLLRARGAEILDADLFARQVLAPDSPGLREVQDHFGPSVFNSDGTLNRKALAQRIFAEIADRKRLESIVHPRVRKRFIDELERLRASPVPPAVIVYVVPLFFEAGIPRHEFDHVATVFTPSDIAVRRVVARDSCQPEEVERRLAAQLAPEEKAALADSVIVNDADLEQLKVRVSEWVHRYAPALEGSGSS